MITKSGPKVLEYNVRFGDPETQSVLPLLETDLAEVMVACTSGTLQNLQLKVASKFAATVVVAAGGYPDAYKKGIEVKIDSVSKGRFYVHTRSTFRRNKCLHTLCRSDSFPCRYNTGRRQSQDVRRQGPCRNSNGRDVREGCREGLLWRESDPLRRNAVSERHRRTSVEEVTVVITTTEPVRRNLKKSRPRHLPEALHF